MSASGTLPILDRLGRALAAAPSAVLDQSGVTLLLDGVWRARCAILDVYDRGISDNGARLKPDDSPVTDADLAADRILRHVLASDLGLAAERVISEEHPMDAAGIAGMADDEHVRFFVDPLDGTREFIKRSGQFVICIGAVRCGRPIFGLIHAPVTGASMLAWKSEDGHRARAAAFRMQRTATSGPENGAWTLSELDWLDERLPSRNPRSSLKLLVSGSSPDGAPGPSRLADILRSGKVALNVRVVPVGSALKFCYIADGTADVYLRRAPTSYWDTVAGQAIVECAGGSVWMFETAGAQPAVPMTYCRASLSNTAFAVFRAGLDSEVQAGILESVGKALRDHSVPTPSPFSKV